MTEEAVKSNPEIVKIGSSNVQLTYFTFEFILYFILLLSSRVCVKPNSNPSDPR